MKPRPIDQLVYEAMFPRGPRPNDPTNFYGLLQRNLVPEVRWETAAFYGNLDSREAQYPGLDYCHPPHRMRLSRFTWHRRLFRAFDALALTPSEIAGLTKWEGTRWAKERFEKEQGITIRDTTGDCIADWVPPELRKTDSKRVHFAQGSEDDEMQDVEEKGSLEEVEEAAEEEEDVDDSDMDAVESIGVDLNARLRAAVALREAGDQTAIMDEAWDQWFKEAVEAGRLPPFPASRVRSGPPNHGPTPNFTPGRAPHAGLSSLLAAPPRTTAGPSSNDNATVHLSQLENAHRHLHSQSRGSTSTQTTQARSQPVQSRRSLVNSLLSGRYQGGGEDNLILTIGAQVAAATSATLASTSTAPTSATPSTYVPRSHPQQLSSSGPVLPSQQPFVRPSQPRS